MLHHGNRNKPQYTCLWRLNHASGSRGKTEVMIPRPTVIRKVRAEGGKGGIRRRCMYIAYYTVHTRTHVYYIVYNGTGYNF